MPGQMPIQEPNSGDVGKVLSEHKRAINDLYTRLGKKQGGVYAKVWVGAAEPPTKETGTLWYDTEDPTAEVP